MVMELIAGVLMAVQVVFGGANAPTNTVASGVAPQQSNVIVVVDTAEMN